MGIGDDGIAAIHGVGKLANAGDVGAGGEELIKIVGAVLVFSVAFPGTCVSPPESTTWTCFP